MTALKARRRSRRIPLAVLIERYLPMQAAGLSHKQAARRLGVRVGTLRTALSRARTAGDTRVAQARKSKWTSESKETAA